MLIFISVLCLFCPALIVLFLFRDILFQKVAKDPSIRLRSRGFSKEREFYFSDCIDRVPINGTIDIVAGEANCNLYTNRVAEAMEKAAERGIKIRMICGPILLVDEMSHTSPILELFSKGKIELFRKNSRAPEHFRIGSNGHVFWEDTHRPGERGWRTSYNMPQNIMVMKYYKRKFNHLLSSEDVKKDTRKDDFILATQGELDRLYEKVSREFGE